MSDTLRLIEKSRFERNLVHVNEKFVQTISIPNSTLNRGSDSGTLQLIGTLGL